MNDIWAAFDHAFTMIIRLDAGLWDIVVLSLAVNLGAVLAGAAIGLPLGAVLGIYRFPGQRFLSILVSAMMGLPPVVVGLLVYLLLSRSGPLGSLNLLFTPLAMIIAQTVLVTPIIAALARQELETLWATYGELMRSLGIRRHRAIPTLLWDGRVALLTALLAGFGRASAEVGAVMIVGGNIAHQTRVMTTAITVETAKGELALALGLGLILLMISLLLNGAAFALRARTRPAPALGESPS